VSVLTTCLVSIAVAGGIGWIIANQLVDVANQPPLYRQNDSSGAFVFGCESETRLASWPDDQIAATDFSRLVLSPGARRLVTMPHGEVGWKWMWVIPTGSYRFSSPANRNGTP